MKRILTKLGTCIDMEQIWFGIANGQILSMFDRVICPDLMMAGYYSLTFLLYIKITYVVNKGQYTSKFHPGQIMDLHKYRQ